MSLTAFISDSTLQVNERASVNLQRLKHCRFVLHYHYFIHDKQFIL